VTDLLAGAFMDQAWDLSNGVQEALKSVFDGIFVALQLLWAGFRHAGQGPCLQCGNRAVKHFAAI